MNNSLLGKTRALFCAVVLCTNVCSKFTVDPFSRFRTGARQVFTIQKFFPSEIPLTMKIATSSYRLSDFF